MTSPPVPRLWPVILGFVLLSGIISLAGWRAFEHQKQDIQQNESEELLDRARFQARLVSIWIDKLKEDAGVYRRIPSRLNVLRKAGGEWDQESLRVLFTPLLRNREIREITLIDSLGHPLFAFPEKSGNVLALQQMAQERSLSSTHPAVLGITQFPSGSERFCLAVPISQEEMGGDRPVGILLVAASPAPRLIPILEYWPGKAGSTESGLLQREGPNGVFLNPLRNRKNAAFHLRIPMARTELVGVQALLGRQGPLQGKDYRGRDVIGAAQPIPGTDMILLAKEDLAEADAPLRRAALISGGGTGTLILLTAACIGFWGMHIRHRITGELLKREQAYSAAQDEAEAATRERERRFRILLETADALIGATDMEGAITWCNTRLAEFFDTKEENLLGRHMFDLLNESQKETVQREFERTLRKGSCQGVDLVYASPNHPSRPLRHVRWNFSRLEDGAGATTGFMGVGQDITDSKMNEERLQTFLRLQAVSLAINQALLHIHERPRLLREICRIAVQEGGCLMAWVGMVDPDGGIVRVEASAGKTEGYLDQISIRIGPGPLGQGPTGRALTNGIPVICHDFNEAPEVSPWREKALKQGFRSSAAFPIPGPEAKGPDETGRPQGALSLYSSEPGFFGHNTIQLGVRLAADIAFALDILKREEDKQQAEEHLQRLNEELEERVRDRTLALETAVRELEAFTYSVSHDLRAPLRGIDGFSRILEEDFGVQLPQEARTHLARIRQATQRMGNLIEDLLSLARLSRAELVRESVNLSEIALRVQEDLRIAHSGRNVEVDVMPDGWAMADPRLIQTVLENLLGNAWKFTRDRDPARVAFGYSEQDGKRVFHVSDNGVGFDMAYSNKLFQPFQRLHNLTEFEGTGIGLASSQRILQRHGGSIWVQSTLGEGTTFYFSLD